LTDPFIYAIIKIDLFIGKAETMELLINLWSSYSICYAIGYMLLIKPGLKRSRRWDAVFYGSLLFFSTMKYLG
jgi:hypothetical protein